MLFKRQSSFSEKDFESVVRACRAGNSQAQRVLFKQYFGYAKSVCLRYSSSVEEAEDVLNEGFLKVFQNLDRYDVSQPFKAWLRTIMINTAISYYRKNKKYLHDTVSLEEAPYPRFEEDVLDKITAEEILDLVQQIRPIYRTVFVMYVVDGYNHREIADLLHLNEATVRSHFVRARARLQQLVIQHYPALFSKSWATQPYRHNEN